MNEEERDLIIKTVDKLNPTNIIYLLIGRDLLYLTFTFAVWLVVNIFFNVNFFIVFFAFIAIKRVKAWIDASKVKEEDIDKIKDFVKNLF